MNDFRLCIIIPCYNHARRLRGVLGQLDAYPYPRLIVNDGSDEANRHLLAILQSTYSADRFVDLQINRGKGAALLAGMRIAERLGFSHALQLDADGQHDLTALAALLEEAQRCPDHVISALPVFDAQTPRARRWGRRLTNFWTAVETCSLTLQDSMCGLRIYPLAPALAAGAAITRLRMSFDIEILVRLYWAGTGTLYYPVRVSYPADNTSNFKMGRDNWDITLTHVRLCCAMPLQMLRRLRSRRSAEAERPAKAEEGERLPAEHWAVQRELQGLAGLKFLLRLYNLAGRRPLTWLLYPVVCGYWLSAAQARRHSRRWLETVTDQQRRRGIVAADRRALTTFNHFYGFACSMLDKVASWNGGLRLGREVCYAPGAEACLKRGLNVRGRLIIGSHLGDLEVCRALAQEEGAQVITAVVFTSHARRFQEAMAEFAPRSRLNIMALESIGPETALLFRERIAQGEMIAIVGDRVSPYRGHGHGSRVSYVDFMGQSAPFAHGPFILAALLSCPVILLFALHENGRLVIYAEDFAAQVVLRKATRSADLNAYIRRYAAALERHALRHPLDWYNFYDFFARA